ncbi:DUF6427 family protein [Pedobacter sp. SYSU D00535]|uniref:DUF6427 family protein n=1 Tax=Pedobacter sp. SYSU D00535 TaxID=2810308 RepID=UPI001A9756C1|nr:DUF6427 family protein [Pedobacter sp. SYSU D00535]
MIEQFKRLNPVNLLFLIAIAVFIRIGIFLQTPEISSFDILEPYANYVVSIDSQNLFSPAANAFFALVVTLIQAIIFSRVVNNYNLLGKPSFLPGLMYITASSLLTPFLVLSPALLCNFLMIWLIHRFLSVYRKNEARSVMFDCGMIIGVGSLIYFPFATMLVVLWIALAIFRPFNWREWVAGIVGFMTIFFFLGVFYYLNDSFQELNTSKMPLAHAFPKNLNINLYDYIVVAPLLLIMVLSVVSLQQKLYRSNMHIRKSYLLLFFLLVFAFLSFYLKPDYHLYHFLLAVPPVAVFMSHYFMNASKKWFYESLYLLLISFIIYFQFH